MLCGNYILSNRSEWTFYFLSSVQFNFTIGDQYLKSKEPIIFLRYRTPNIPHVVKDFTEIFKINVPSVKEQEKISKTLNYLDQSILVETKKIGSIKKIKKFLLQNMFI